MSLILNIDTSQESATVCLAENGELLRSVHNEVQKEHAVFLHDAIKNILASQPESIHSLSAIAVTEGPGSYTGLRVGMASAKGLCYALDIPLITIGTLNMMAYTAIHALNASERNDTLFCPMIDARRMEVFTALFDAGMNEITPASALVLDADSFNEKLRLNRICFFGSGAEKFKQLLHHENAFFIELPGQAVSLGHLSQKKYENNQFANLAHCEPLYVKEFYSSTPLHTIK